MRDAAGELADSFELLRLPQLFFKLTAFRDIGIGADHLRRAAGRVMDELSFISQPANFSILAPPVPLAATVSMGQKILQFGGFLLMFIGRVTRNFPAGMAPFSDGAAENLGDVFADP